MSVGVRRISLLLVLAGLSVLGLAACGGSSSSSTSSSTSTAGSETKTAAAESESAEGGEAQGPLAEIEKKVKEEEKPPVPISLPTLSKRPTAGMTVGFVTCPLPECKLAEEATKEAASLLGWKVTVYQGGLTPETQVTANKEAVQAKPDGIVSIMIVPSELLEEPLEEAKQAGIPIASISDMNPPEGAIISVSAASRADLETQSEAMANWIVADSGGKANVLAYVGKGGSEAQEVPADIVESVMEKSCPECQVTEQTFNIGDAGTKFPGEVVSYLQQHPEVEYIAMPFGTASTGVGAAIKAAGLPVPKITTRVSTPENFANVEAGLEAIAVPEDIKGAMWLATDALARHSVGDSLSECGCEEPLAQYQILTKETIKDPSKEWEIPDLKQSFEKIWDIKG